MSNYDAPIYMTYTVLAGSLIAGADLQDVSGPEGLTGKVVAISGLLTTGVTVAASSIVVGDGSTADLYATVPAPVQAIDTVVNQGLVKINLSNSSETIEIGEEISKLLDDDMPMYGPTMPMDDSMPEGSLSEGVSTTRKMGYNKRSHNNQR
mgnify:CR=1 FL=1